MWQTCWDLFRSWLSTCLTLFNRIWNNDLHSIKILTLPLYYTWVKGSLAFVPMTHDVLQSRPSSSSLSSSLHSTCPHLQHQVLRVSAERDYTPLHTLICCWKCSLCSILWDKLCMYSSWWWWCVHMFDFVGVYSRCSPCTFVCVCVCGSGCGPSELVPAAVIDCARRQPYQQAVY